MWNSLKLPGRNALTCKQKLICYSSRISEGKNVERNGDPRGPTHKVSEWEQALSLGIAPGATLMILCETAGLNMCMHR